MGRIVIFVYGVIAYGAFLAAILYAIGFVTKLGVPKNIDDGPAAAVGTAILIDVGLLALFAIQHTIMARPRFKDWLTKFIPRPAERSTFVLLASAILGLLFWQWRPLPGVIWSLDTPAIWWTITGVSLVGWAMVFYSTFIIDHFDLFGLRQVTLHLLGREYHHPRFQERSLYRWIRHPLMAGFIIAFWVTPEMTHGHLLFAAVSTGYIFFGIQVEERDLQRFLGGDYLAYRKRTPMLLPRPRRKA